MKKKILIVEDDEVVAKIYANRFRDEGFDAETQGDGVAALERIPIFRPNAVLLDLDLPRLHGVDVIKRVRAQPLWHSLPLVVLSNAFQRSVIEQAWKAGASTCLTKAGSTPEQVVAAVCKEISGAGDPLLKVSQPTTTTSVVTKAARFSDSRVDPEIQMEFTHIFARETAQSLTDMRLLWSGILACEEPAVKAAKWAQLQRTVHALTGNAIVVECLQMADLSSAFEGLLTELSERPDSITPSTLRTVAQTMDFLAYLLLWVGKEWPAQITPPQVLVVDDELIGRKAAVTALELVEIRPTVAESAAEALQLLQENLYDLILLDVDMPGITGFEMCRQLRARPAHQETPVIFVTGLTSFQDRVQSTLTGGNDLIGKPYLLIELTVKALISILRRQLQAV